MGSKQQIIKGNPSATALSSHVRESIYKSNELTKSAGGRFGNIRYRLKQTLRLASRLKTKPPFPLAQDSGTLQWRPPSSSPIVGPSTPESGATNMTPDDDGRTIPVADPPKIASEAVLVTFTPRRCTNRSTANTVTTYTTSLAPSDMPLYTRMETSSIAVSLSDMVSWRWGTETGGNIQTSAVSTGNTEDNYSYFSFITEDLQNCIRDWKGHPLSGLGPLQIYDILLVRRDSRVREFFVYLFKEAIICIGEKNQSLGGLLSDVDNGSVGGGSNSGQSKGVLRLQGRIYVRHIKQVTVSSSVDEMNLTISMKEAKPLDSFVLIFKDRSSLEVWKQQIQSLVNMIQQRHSQPAQLSLYNRGLDLEDFSKSNEAARGSTPVDRTLDSGQPTMSSSMSHGTFIPDTTPGTSIPGRYTVRLSANTAGTDVTSLAPSDMPLHTRMETNSIAAPLSDMLSWRLGMETGDSIWTSIVSTGNTQDDGSPFSDIKEDLRNHIIGWSGDPLSGLGPLQMYDLLGVCRNSIVREFFVYLFKEAILCIVEVKKQSSGRLLSTGQSKDMLRIKGRIYVRHIRQVTLSSSADEMSLTISVKDKLDSFILIFKDRSSLELWKQQIQTLMNMSQPETDPI